MRLTDLNPRFLRAGGEGISLADGSPAPERHGVGIIMDCPCGNADENHQLYVPFLNPIDGGPTIEPNGWQRTGDTVDTLTLAPSILRHGACKWHGWIRDGAVISC